MENTKQEIVEALESSLSIIKRLISSQRVVNLDEAIAYYESLIKDNKTTYNENETVKS